MRKDSVRYRVLMLFSSNLMLQLMGFAYRVALTRTLGASALGLNSLVMQFYGLVVSFCISGLNVAVTSVSARIKPENRRGLLFCALIVFALLFLAAAAPIAVFSRRICKKALGEPALIKTLYLMLFCIFMTGIENVFKSVFMGAGRVGRCAASELTEQAVRFIAVIILLKAMGPCGDPQSVFYIMLGMVLSEFVSVGFLSASFFGLYGLPKSERMKAPFLRELVRIAFPAILTAVSGTAFASFGALLLPKILVYYGAERASALAEIGIMNNSAVPLTMLPMALVGSLAAVLMPEVCSLSSRGISPIRLVSRSLTAAIAVGLIWTLILTFFGTSISKALFGCAAERDVFILLAAKAFVIFLQVVSVSAMNGLLMQRTVFVLALSGEAYQLVLILLLTPVLGLKGYALGMLAGEAVRLFANMTALSLKLKNGYGIKRPIMIKSA